MPYYHSLITSVSVAGWPSALLCACTVWCNVFLSCQSFDAPRSGINTEVSSLTDCKPTAGYNAFMLSPKHISVTYIKQVSNESIWRVQTSTKANPVWIHSLDQTPDQMTSKFIDFVVQSYICGKIFMNIRQVFPEIRAKVWKNARSRNVKESFLKRHLYSNDNPN